MVSATCDWFCTDGSHIQYGMYNRYGEFPDARGYLATGSHAGILMGYNVFFLSGFAILISCILHQSLYIDKK